VNPTAPQIRVPSNPRAEAFGADDNAAPLKAEGVRLMAQAASVALQLAVATDEAEQARTYR